MSRCRRPASSIYHPRQAWTRTSTAPFPSTGSSDSLGSIPPRVARSIKRYLKRKGSVLCHVQVGEGVKHNGLTAPLLAQRIPSVEVT
jgi:hypothetical protein